MKYLFQFLIIIAFSFVGEVLHWALPFPIPASIYGITLMFIALEFKIIKPAQIKETATFLIAVMPIMFLPPAVEIIDNWGYVKESWWQYVIITFISTFVVMAATGWATQYIIRRKKGEKQ